MNIKDTILAVGVLSFATSAHAIPVLQVGIGGGTYDTTTQTVVTSATSFSVYAYGTPGGNTSAADLLSGEYFLSIAVTPKQTETNPKPNYGSFQLNGTNVPARRMVGQTR